MLKQTKSQIKEKL